MAKLRKFVCYRHIERPNTRKSKYRKKSFVRGNPTVKIVKFNVGNLQGTFSHRIDLIAKEAIQMRDNAIESGRTTATRLLERVLGKNGFRLQVRPYPHHILREHALAAGAGADRFSSGMAHSFGKPAGNAVRLRANQIIISVYVDAANVQLARESMEKANYKLPKSCKIIVNKL